MYGRRGARIAPRGGVRVHRPDAEHRVRARLVDLDERGFILTDEAFRTSAPGIYGAGDARRGATKQLASAVGDGVAALISLRSYLQAHGDICAVDDPGLVGLEKRPADK